MLIAIKQLTASGAGKMKNDNVKLRGNHVALRNVKSKIHNAP